MLSFNYEEVEKYRIIIASQFSQIQKLENKIKNLETLNAVKYESFSQQIKSQLDEDIKKLTELKNIIEFKQTKIYDDILLLKKKIDNKFNCIDYLLNKNNVECPICYEPINISNLFSPGCHMEHIHCLKCSKMINKCSLCKVPFINEVISDFDQNVIDHNNLVLSFNNLLNITQM